MEEQRSNEPNKIGTFLSSAVSKILNLVMILVIIALAGVGVFFWNKNQLLEQGSSDLQDRMDKFEEMNDQAKVRDVVVKEEVEEAVVKSVSKNDNGIIDDGVIKNEEKDNNKIACGKLLDFKNEAWSNKLDTLYKKHFSVGQVNIDTLWTASSSSNDVSACIIDNSFIFIPEYFEFGCGMILKYDVDKNILVTTSVGAPKSCATKFGKSNKYSIEYFGSTGNGGMTKNFHSIYYFKEDRIEDIRPLKKPQKVLQLINEI